jgi:hypothetical protein
VRHNHEGKPFVIMEYVSGPNLRQILDESPAGVGTQKAAFFLREIAKGLTYLHECGIVHRDLKPANIFYENGYVKIGDYGLSKHITTSQYSGQTVTVGTVHYMAPEIGAGKYDRSIDIYAMGALLFEMLTGTPPYIGASPTEVLMKHLSSEPDVKGVPQPFARVIQRAMNKDPNQRYKSVQEMVEDVFGAEHVRQSVSVFAPEDLSMIAERVAKRAAVGAGAGVAGGGGAGAGGSSSSLPGAAQQDEWGRLANWMDDVGGRVKQMWNEPRGGAAGAPAAPGAGTLNYAASALVNDPLSTRHRWQLAVVVSIIAPLAAALVAPHSLGAAPLSFLFVFTAMWGATIGLMIAHRALLPRMGKDSEFLQRLIAGQCAALGLVLLSLPVWAFDGPRGIGGTLLAIILPYCLFSSKGEASPERTERVQFGELFGAGVAAFVLSMIFRGHWQLAVAVAAGTSLLLQVLSPWDPVRGALTKAIKEAEEAGDEAKSAQLKAEAEQAFAPASPHAAAAARVEEYAQANFGSGVAVAAAPARKPQYRSRRVGPFVRVVWVIGIVALITMGVMFCVAGGTTRRAPDVGPYVAAGVSALLLGLLCVIKGFQTTFYGWWGYLFKPVLMTACVAAIASSGIVLSNLHYSPTEDDVLIGTFWIVMPSLLLIVLLFLPGRWPASAKNAGGGGAATAGFQRVTSTGPSPYQRRWALALTALGLVGCCGLQRLYVGKIRTGILYLITLGLCGIGQILDALRIFRGTFQDKYGRPLEYWGNPPAGAAIGAAVRPPPIPQAPSAPAPPPAEEKSPILAEIDRVAADCCDAVKDAVAVAADGIRVGIGGTFRRPASPVVIATGEQPRGAARELRQSSALPGGAVAAVEVSLRGILSALAGLFLFVATVASLALALDVPAMLYHGVPTPQVKRDIEQNLFAGFEGDWPSLMWKVGAVSVGILMVLAVTLQTFARQRGGGLHMLRGLVGSAGLVLAMLPLAEAVSVFSPWRAVGDLVESKQYTAAADTFLASFQSWAAVGAGVIFLASIVLLAWPPRRAKEWPPVAPPSRTGHQHTDEPASGGAPASAATVKGA